MSSEVLAAGDHVFTYAFEISVAVITPVTFEVRLNGVALPGYVLLYLLDPAFGTLHRFTLTGKVTGVSAGDVLSLVLGPSGPPSAGWSYVYYSRIQTA